MTNWTLASNFIRQKGSATELARLEYLLEGNAPPPEVLEEFRSTQREDGGWAPFWAADYSSLDATCYRLTQLEALGLGPEEMFIQEAIRLLAERQNEDGSWEEDRSVKGAAPPWAKPGDKPARLYLTANCGFWMSIWAADQVQARRAAEYLLAHTKRDGHLPGFMQANWLAKPLWGRTGFTEAEEKVSAYLEKQAPKLPAASLAWLATALMEAAYPAEDPLLAAAVNRLAWLQALDGHWAGEGGQDVHTTLETLRVLKHSGRP